MKITFPHLGDVHLTARLLFRELRVEVVVPERNSRKALERGGLISPEEICLPFKLMAGNLIDAYEKGADTVIMPATGGPCRLGEYAELLRSVLESAGIFMHWIVIESPAQIGWQEFIKRLSEAAGGSKRSAIRGIRALNGARRLMKGCDALRTLAYERAGITMEPEKCAKILRNCAKALEEADCMKEGIRLIAYWRDQLKALPISEGKNPLKILLSGEIYSLIDSYANRRIEEKLIELGVSFRKRVNVSWWIRHTLSEAILPEPIKAILSGEKRKYRWLPFTIGGYAKQTVEEGGACNAGGFDGMIQIFPMGCMPEIVAKSVLSRLAEEENMRVLSIVFDEMDGEAGFVTRLEAFVDMLERRKGCIS